MPTPFVAVVRAGRIPAGLALELAGTGASAVYRLADLPGSGEPDDTTVVLLDLPPVAARLDAVLATLRAIDSPADPADPAAGMLAVTTVRPVTDTLKRVGADGVLAGTADREHHRFVATPIATRLGPLRTALADAPEAITPGEILAVLVRSGATVVATS